MLGGGRDWDFFRRKEVEGRLSRRKVWLEIRVVRALGRIRGQGFGGTYPFTHNHLGLGCPGQSSARLEGALPQPKVGAFDYIVFAKSPFLHTPSQRHHQSDTMVRRITSLDSESPLKSCDMND